MELYGCTPTAHSICLAQALKGEDIPYPEERRGTFTLRDGLQLASAQMASPLPSSQHMSAAPVPEPMALPAAMAKSKHELRQMLAIRLLTREECLAQLQALSMSEAEALEWIKGC